MLAKLNAWLLRGATSVTWIFTGLLVLLVMANVVARYLLGIGILWAEEASRLLFVWVVFLGAYIALCRKGHMAIVMIVDFLAPLPRRLISVIGWGFVFVFLAALTVAGYRLVMGTVGFGRVTPILGISAAWAYLSVPLSAGLMALRVLQEIAEAWRSPPEHLDGSAKPLEAAL
jgi:TRAP-type C4-dicarboxylate transport system permease small subunit